MSNFKDLTGQKFGRLTVIKRVENNKWGRAQWLCQCECGNTTILTGNALLRGNTKSCGCLAAENHLHHFFDIVGQKFNRLTVLKYLGKSKWLCKCDCGNETIVQTSSLKSGRIKSCGCYNLEKAKKPLDNIIGKKYGKLTVLEYVGNSKWLCKCDCGNTKIISGQDFKSGRTQSCGCLHKELLIKQHTTHNKTHTRLHRIWSRMKTCCYNKNTKGYKIYGLRGITICDEWLSDFINFYNWAMNNGYSHNLTIDRIDVNGNYCPENCRWATKKEQANNTRVNRLITYNNETHTLKQWSEILNINYSKLHKRLTFLNWSIEKAFEIQGKTI